MGYSHYINRKTSFTINEWCKILNGAQSVLLMPEVSTIVANGTGEAGTMPEAHHDAIVFNGIGEDSYETFYLFRTIENEDDKADSYKTAHKPYDKVVCAMLILVSMHTSSRKVQVRSDGYYEEWAEGFALLARAGIKVPERTRQKLRKALGRSCNHYSLIANSTRST